MNSVLPMSLLFTLFVFSMNLSVGSPLSSVPNG